MEFNKTTEAAEVAAVKAEEEVEAHLTHCKSHCNQNGKPAPDECDDDDDRSSLSSRQ